MIRAGISALLSHWWRNPLQLATLLAGIALSTALWSGVQAINAEARASYAQAADVVSMAGRPQITRKDGAEIPLEDYVALRRMGWQVSPVLSGQLSVGDVSFEVTGVEPLTFPGPLPQALMDGEATEATAASRGAVILAHPENVAALQGLGYTVRADPARRSGTLVTDISAAEQILGDNGAIRQLLLGTEQPLGRPALPAEYQTRQPAAQADVARLTRSFHLNLTAFGLLSFAVGIFIVYGAVGLAFEQRRGVFRTLRALGLPLGYLMGFLALELGLFALLSGAAGVAMGYVIAAALLPDVAATLGGLYGAQVPGELELRPLWSLSGMAMAIGGTAVAGVAVLVKLVRLPVLSFNHPRAMSLGAAATAKRLAQIAVVLIFTGVSASLFTDGLLAGFALLGGLLVGAAFLLPWCLSICLRFAETHADSPLAQWFWADSRQQLPGLSMALMALLLAMAANIGVATMVSSFRLTFTEYLDQRLASELYLTARSEEQAKDIKSFLEGQVDALLPIQSADTRVGNLPVEIYGIRVHATYREKWPLLRAEQDVWDTIDAGGGALISEQLARRETLDLGDQLPWGDRVIGIYSDYGNTAGQVLVNEVTFRQRYPDVPLVRFGVRTSDPERISNALQEAFSLGEEGVVNQQQLKKFSLGIFERTFAVTAALNILTLSIGGLAMLISLLTLATMRLPQLAPVWALGLTRLSLARMELLRAVCLAALTGLFALPLGLLLGWVLLAVVNVEAFGWRLPMFLFPADYMKLGLLTIIAAFLASAWPAIRLSRVDPQALLKVFSNDR